ncbi:MAG: glycoside hydrolase family 27 protein [Acutalibacteraceae bacterium]|nr:glycoside hydrolase family 27 protein [Eubacterium sp.]
MKDFIKKPPMGWNSWDCYGAGVTEDELLGNAEFMRDRLKQYGYQYVVCDIQWYEPAAKGNVYNNFADLCMDEYSRLIPAVNRFPSSANGAGFKPIADKIHSMGLKFGIHIMRGIPRQAVHRNTRIYGTTARARDIASQFSLCPWNTDMYGVDTEKRGAEEYYDSLFKLYASWGVDFVKVDDIANTEFSPQNPYSADKEIEMIRAAIDRSGRDMVLSLSPGPAPLNKAEHLSKNANMWRISGDFWDRWDKLLNMFSFCEKWYPYVKDGSFPDCDILPLGKLCIDGSYMGDMGRDSGFTKEEQKTMMTLWAVFRSPLFFGGELRLTDNYTLSLVTNPEVINVNQNSEKPLFVYNKGGIAVWQTKIENCTAVAVFNLSDEEKHYKLSFSDLGLENVRAVRDLWARKDIPKCENDVVVSLKPHSSEFFEIY